MNLGNIAVSQVLYFHFTTRQFSTGAPITSASLVLSVYKDDGVTQSTSGITTTFLTGFDGVVGLVSVKIDTSADGTFYAAGHDFSVVVTTGTADSVSIVGEVVGYFSIANRSAAVSDKTGFSLSSGGVQAIWDALTSALVTVGSIGKLLVDNINATISSRSTYAGADTAGTSTLLTRIASTLTITTGKVDVNDKTGFELAAAYDPAKTAAQAGDSMDVATINGTAVIGTGTAGDLWRA